eukprot:1176058-Prorocentrum_minimum.AAC.1
MNPPPVAMNPPPVAMNPPPVALNLPQVRAAGRAGGGGRKARGRKEVTKPSEKPGRQVRKREKGKDRRNG